MSRILNLKIIVGLVALAGAILLGLRLSAAGDISSEQLLLKLSDLPSGSSIQIQRPLIPGSPDNGMVDKNGADIVQGYVTGERVDFMVPLVKMEGMPEDQAMAQAYVANLVYRFADEQVAANEFQRLTTSRESMGARVAWTNKPTHRSAIVDFNVNVPDIRVQYRWFVLQRGKFLVILTMPGPATQDAIDAADAKLYNELQTTRKGIEDWSRAVEALFITTVSLLESH